MAVSTMRSGFTPFDRSEERAADRKNGRATARVSTLDILAERTVGKTRLGVIPCASTLGKTLGRESDQTGYALVALGNTSRETKYLGRWDTFPRAEEAMREYSPRYGLLGKH